MDIVRYDAWLGQRGNVAAISLATYFSAIYMFLQALPAVAVGSLSIGVREGLTNCQRNTAPLPQRLPLPAPIVLTILEMGERLLRSSWTPHDPDIAFLRAIVATVTSYVFFNRGEWSVCTIA
jgi:hypothetical protein